MTSSSAWRFSCMIPWRPTWSDAAPLTSLTARFKDNYRWDESTRKTDLLTLSPLLKGKALFIRWQTVSHVFAGMKMCSLQRDSSVRIRKIFSSRRWTSRLVFKDFADRFMCLDTQRSLNSHLHGDKLNADFLTHRLKHGGLQVTWHHQTKTLHLSFNWRDFHILTHAHQMLPWRNVAFHSVQHPALNFPLILNTSRWDETRFLMCFHLPRLFSEGTRATNVILTSWSWNGDQTFFNFYCWAAVFGVWGVSNLSSPHHSTVRELGWW